MCGPGTGSGRGGRNGESGFCGNVRLLCGLERLTHRTRAGVECNLFHRVRSGAIAQGLLFEPGGASAKGGSKRVLVDGEHEVPDLETGPGAEMCAGGWRCGDVVMYLDSGAGSVAM